MDEHDNLVKSFSEMHDAFDAAPPECNDFELASHYAGLIIKAVPVLDQLATELTRLRKVEIAAYRIALGWRLGTIKRHQLDALVETFDAQS